MNNRRKRLPLNKVSVRNLTPSQSDQARGGINATSVSCGSGNTSCQPSVCNSCYNTDCCLMKP